jgi:hypothetical protein
MLRSVAVALLVTFTTVGCYNTYYLKQETFAGLQRSDATAVNVTDNGGESVQVSDDSKLFARSMGGRRYQITPFNFKMTKSQLVASDRDYILMLDEVESYEVDKLSTWKTVGLISLGVAAVGGFITAMAIMYGSKQIGEN